MANTLLRLFSQTNLFTVLKNFKVKKLPVLSVANVRTLYSQQTLGMDGFFMQQERTRSQMTNIADKFRDKMNEYSNEDSKSMIFTEDLKNMIHLAETDEDIDIVIRMIKKFNSQNKQVRFGNFVFGPVVMRLLYKNRRVDEALTLFKDPEMVGFFDQIITYQILLDLLFESGRYQDILNVFEDITSRQLEGKYPRNVVVLTVAACYKINTKESLDFVIKLWKDLTSIGHLPMRRATTFAAGLALNQGNPDVALEILVSARNQNYTTVRNLKVAAYAELGRFEDAMDILKNILSNDVPEGTTVHTFNKDILEKIKMAVEKLDNNDIKTEFNRIEQLLTKQGHIIDQNLDVQLCSQIQKPPNMNNRERTQGRYENRNRGNFQNRGRNFTYSQRPGLNELV